MSFDIRIKFLQNSQNSLPKPKKFPLCLEPITPAVFLSPGQALARAIQQQEEEAHVLNPRDIGTRYNRHAFKILASRLSLTLGVATAAALHCTRDTPVAITAPAVVDANFTPDNLLFFIPSNIVAAAPPPNVDRRQPSPETPVDTATDLVAIAAAAISMSGAHDPPSTKMQRMNAPSLPHHLRKLPKKTQPLNPQKKKKKKKNYQIESSYFCVQSRHLICEQKCTESHTRIADSVRARKRT
jgi:hypothetical protein